MAGTSKFSQNDIIKEFKKVHGKKYNYSRVKYLTNNKPKWLMELNEKISIDFLDQKSIPGYMFTATNFLSIAYYHGKFTDTSSINRYLNNKHLYNIAKTDTDKINQIKSSKIQHAISHEQWIKNILNSINT